MRFLFPMTGIHVAFIESDRTNPPGHSNNYTHCQRKSGDEHGRKARARGANQVLYDPTPSGVAG